MPSTLSAAAEEYLETIYNITVEGDHVVSARLAEKFHVSPASVAEMLRRLERDGYLTGNRATGPTLTELGIAKAEQDLRHHRLCERFLADVMGMDWIAAHQEAESLQHALTPALEARMVELLNNPTTCPHGNPIPGSAPRTLDYLRAHHAQRLSATPVGEPVQVLCISEVVEDETALLQYVGEKGIRPGTTLEVKEQGPTDDSPLLIEVRGQGFALARAVADKIWVYHPESAPPAATLGDLTDRKN